MLKFIKIENGEGITFNGERPFVHWFDGPRSVNLWHYHTMLIMGPRTISVSFSEDSIFSIYTKTNINNPEWQDIKSCSTKYYESTGASKNGEYIHQIIILAKYSGEGEYIDDMIITYGGTNHAYKVGIELFGENEQLNINLANMGIEIPDAIVKALYTSDLFEDHTDWALINRKWRELLSNYMDIWGCKGNYKSLINSLKWFEYGDLVELREVWKHDTNGGTKLSDKPISQWLTKKLQHESLYSSKTTYLALRHLNIDTEDVYKWEIDELRMKMALLGNFFETYFMPVHLDLIYSVIEDVYYDVVAKLATGSYETLYNQCDSNCNDFDIKIGEDDWDSGAVTDAKEFNLDMVEAWGYSETNPVAFSATPTAGVTTINPGVTNDADLFSTISQNYMGIGAIIPVSIRLPERPVNGYIETNINDIQQHIDLDLEALKIIPQSIYVRDDFGRIVYENGSQVTEIKNMYCIDTEFLIKTDGEYYIMFVFKGAKTYSKKVNIKVLDNTSASLSFFKLVFDEYKLLNTNPFDIINLDEQLEVFSSAHDTPDLHTLYHTEPDLNEYDATLLSKIQYKQYVPIYETSEIIRQDQPRKLPIYTFHGNEPTLANIGYNNVASLEQYLLNLGYWSRIAIADNKIQYIQLISKYGAEPNPNMFGSAFATYFTRTVYIPEFHKLVRLKPTDEVEDIYPIVCTPLLNINSVDGSKKLIWTNTIGEASWIFKSVRSQSTLRSLDNNIIEPFISNPYAGMPMPQGYYDVTLNYRWGHDIKTITSKSPFIKQITTTPDFREYNNYFISEMANLGEIEIIESDDNKTYFKI